MEYAQVPVGVNVAVAPPKLTVPETAVDPVLTVKVVVVTVAALIGSLNVTDILVLTATPLAPFEGVAERTVGGAVSESPPPPPPPPPQVVKRMEIVGRSIRANT